MPNAMTMLDRALVLAQHELEAMNAGDIERAENYFRDRSELLKSVYEKHDEENNEDYVKKLIAMQGYNQTLYDAGLALKEKLRAQIEGSSKTTKAVKSYMQAGMNR